MNCNCYVWNCLLSIWCKIFHTGWKENEFSVLFDKVPSIFNFKMQERNKQKIFHNILKVIEMHDLCGIRNFKKHGYCNISPVFRIN